MDFITPLLLFFSVILGGTLIFVFPVKGQILKLLVSFSVAFLLSLIILHLLPEVYQHSDTHSASIFILIGFFLQIFIEYFSRGVEHGHAHLHTHDKKIPFTIIFGLCLHSFIEGMPLASKLHLHLDHQNNLLMGIILHKIPVAITLMSLLLSAGIKKSSAFLLLVVFALMTPLGLAFSHVFTLNVNDHSLYYAATMGLLIGIFLHISTTILFESSENHRFNFLKLGMIALGVAAVLLTL